MKTSIAVLFFTVAAVSLPHYSVNAGEIPLEWCGGFSNGSPTPIYNCQGTPQQGNPLYSGVLPPDWDAASLKYCALQAASLASAPGNPNNVCPCAGTACSTLTSCIFNRSVSSPQYQAVGFTGTNIAAPTGNTWSTLPPRDAFTCGCNIGSFWGFGPNRQCQCNPGRVYDGSLCIAASTCTGYAELETCATVANASGASAFKNAGKPQICPKPECLVGDPFDPRTGINTQVETLLQTPTLAVKLIYNSVPVGWPVIYTPTPFGRSWSMNFGMRVESNFAGGMVGVFRDGGQIYQFLPGTGNTYISDNDVADKLVKQVSGATITGWQYMRASDDAVEQYDAAGKLILVTARNGRITTLTYSDGTTPVTIAPSAGLLIGIADHFGRQISFTYDAAKRIVTMTDPAGGAYALAYNESTSVTVSGGGIVNNLTSVTFPGSEKRIYYYNEQANTSSTNLPNALTGITDENNNRYATFQYDAQERTIATQLGTGVNRYAAMYNSLNTIVTDPLSTTHTYGLQVTLGVVNSTGITGSACPSCGPATQGFDANGRRSSRTDWNGNLTTYTRADAYGRLDLETSRTEASGSGQARTITTTWNSTFRLPTLITEPNRTTAFTYDANGNVLTKTVTDVSASRSRVWTSTYSAIGQVLTMDGPRTDVTDVTTTTYYANNDADPGKRGNVATITNALSQVTSVTSYDANGRPLTIQDPNGLVSTLTYAPRGWLTSRNVGGEITTYAYDNLGQLTKVTLPDLSYLQYTYDAAHRLAQIQDNLGNKIVYTLDNMGNRTQEDVRDPSNVLAQTRTRVYSSLNRLYQDIGGVSPGTEITQYAYDNQGNLTTVTDPLTHVTTNGYDALNRLIQVTAPGSTVTAYGYNALDQLTSVTDPRSNATTYTIDALNNLTQQASPDTGTTANTYDAAGNVLTSTDAKSQVTAYTYDALNRVISLTYQDGSQVLYGYDAGTNGKGRLTSITEKNPGGTVVTQTAYTYDVKGRLLTDTRTIGAVSFLTQYGYDNAGRLSAVTYPSGRLLTYSFDGAGRIAGITTTPSGGSAQIVVSGITYQPFGGVKGFTYGNGQAYSRTIDLDGRTAGFTLAGSAQTLSFDAASRITASAYFPNPAQSVSYGYDVLDRLTSTITPTTTSGFGYDANGNRTAKTVGAVTKTYAYPSTNNKLSGIAGGGSWAYTHDADGSITNDATNTYTYDTRGRLIQAATALGTVTYGLNSLGQRYAKTVQGTTTVFHYDKQGHLIAESSPTGTVSTEYLYLGDIPVAVFK